jgi:capsular exopolysaccharide synthesis family protein
MSKIFEALQRAQQQAANPADPSAAAETAAPPAPASMPSVGQESSLLWESAPAQQEDLLFGGPPTPPGFAAPPAFGQPQNFGPPPPAFGAPTQGFVPPPPVFPTPAQSFSPPPPAFGAPGPVYVAPPPYTGPVAPAPNFSTSFTPPAFTDAVGPQPIPSPSFVGGLPGQVVPSLPLSNVDAGTPTVWEPPSLVRFSPRSKVVVAQNPTSLAAEQYRVLRTNIVKLSQTQALKVILVTSPGPGDGKTLTTMNLALSFCQKPETRVLLIEADLRKPSVGALVAMNPGPGLADYLAGEATLEHVVRPTSIPNFHLLDSGKRPAMPADLLHSPRLAAMMEVLRSHFNWIVLDGPPTNPVADYELLTPICDGVILVVRPYYTQRDLLRLTTEALRGRKVLGCVINGSKHFERYGSAYGYGYGYGPGNDASAMPNASQKSKMRKKRVTKSTEQI